MESDTLRSGEMLEKYFAQLDSLKQVKNLLHLEALWSGEFWFIAANEFPYDMIAETHHLLVPHRVFAEAWEMTIPEIVELNKIKERVGMDYDSINENTHKRRSVGRHYHLHLLKYKKLTDYNHG